MRIALLSCFAFFFLGFAEAQQVSIKKQVFDKENKTIIPYTTVQVVNSLKYRDGDGNGYFEISALNSDTLAITCIGYKPYKISVNMILNMDSILLVKEVVVLKELVVSKPTINTFGIINDKQGRSVSGGSEAGRTEIATLIEIPETVKIYRISKILLKGKNFREDNPVRLHIYGVDSNGLPGEELLTKEIIINQEQVEDKIVTIDIKEQQIFLENTSFFVGVQWLTSTKVKMFTGPELFETFKENKLLTYRRSLNVNKNHWFGWFKKDMVFFPKGEIPKDDTPINMLASAEIEILSN